MSKKCFTIHILLLLLFFGLLAGVLPFRIGRQICIILLHLWKTEILTPF